MSQSEEEKYTSVLYALSAELGKSTTRVERLMTVSPNQGVIIRFWEIFEEKYPETDTEV